MGDQPNLLHVAGPAYWGEQTVGVWVEWVPGRVHLLMAEILSWVCSDSVVSLASLDFSHFSPGDCLEVKASGADALEAGSVELRAWVPSLRALLGAHEALLPVAGTQPEDGALILGAGRFRLTLPERMMEPPAAIWLSQDNTLRSAGETIRFAQRTRTCLVGVDANHKHLIVLGMPGWKAVPDRDAPWAQYGIECQAIDPVSGWPNWGVLIRLVLAVGGALPVTIKLVDEPRKTVYFSFDEQQAQIPRAPAFVLAQVVGYGDAAPDQLILRAGRGLCTCPFEEVLGGVPRVLRPSAAQQLISARTLVPLQRTTEGSLQAGLSKWETGQEVPLQPLLIAGSESEPFLWGMIARVPRSAALIWLPAEHVSWARMKQEEASSLLLRPGRLLPARLVSSGERVIGSLISTGAARRDVAELRPGTPLRVARAGGETSESGWRGFGRLIASGLLIELQAIAPPADALPLPPSGPIAEHLAASLESLLAKVRSWPVNLRLLPPLPEF